jgi:uncharacterized cupredoxin-like copper-binding protein
MKVGLILAAVTAALALGGTSTAAMRQPTQAKSTHSAALIEQVNVTASDFKFVLNKKTAKRGVVTFKVTNIGAIPHDFKISGRKTRLLQHGESATLRVTFLRKGAYPYICTVPTHVALGMKGVFTIT